jgi:hypothetical protein
MSWIASGVALASGIGSAVLGNRAAKKAARKQAALARAEAQKLRDRAAEINLASKAEIESMRTLRSLDLPAFRQASEQALIQAQKGAERMQRQRMMGRLAPDVRQAIFGGQFQQYVGQEMQRLGQYADLTREILQATERQQQYALGIEQQATSISMGGQAQAIQMEAAAGDLGANILGAVGAAASQYASAQSAKAAQTEAKQEAFMQTALMSDLTPDQLATRRAAYGKQLGLGANYNAEDFWKAFFGSQQ